MNPPQTTLRKRKVRQKSLQNFDLLLLESDMQDPTQVSGFPAGSSAGNPHHLSSTSVSEIRQFVEDRQTEREIVQDRIQGYRLFVRLMI
jgi:hypothetical protein